MQFSHLWRSGQKGVCPLVKRWHISGITGQNIQKLLILAVLASSVASILKNSKPFAEAVIWEFRKLISCYKGIEKFTVLQKLPYGCFHTLATEKGSQNSSFWGAVCLSVTQPQNVTIFQNGSLRGFFFVTRCGEYTGVAPQALQAMCTLSSVMVNGHIK